MRIAIDIRNLQDKHLSGVGWYTVYLLDALFALDSVHEYTLCYTAWKQPPKHLFRWKDVPTVTYKHTRIPSKVLHAAHILFRAPTFEILFGEYDMVLMPNHLFWAFRDTTNIALVLHDFSYRLHPECFTPKMRLWHRLIRPQVLLRRAQALIAVSNQTKEDAVRYGAEEEKVYVVYSGVPKEVKSQHNPLFAEHSKNAILFLSTIEPRKNISRLLEAYTLLRVEHKEIKNPLVLAGGTQWWGRNRVHKEIMRHPFKDDIVVTGYVSQEKKTALLAEAALFVYPSLYEGFGLPPLEAMQSGVPVVASHAPPLPEVLHDAAVLVDPYRPEDIAEAMWQTLSDDILRHDLVEKGYIQVKKYDWSTTAREILHVLEGVVVSSTQRKHKN